MNFRVHEDYVCCLYGKTLQSYCTKYWTNCTFGLYPSSGVWKKLRNKIYIQKNHNTHVQNSHKGPIRLTFQLHNLVSIFVTSPRPHITVRKLFALFFLLARRFPPKLVYHFLSAVRDWLLHICRYPPYMEAVSFIYNSRSAMSWWQGPILHHTVC
jgi:hypothetical protein